MSACRVLGFGFNAFGNISQIEITSSNVPPLVEPQGCKCTLNDNPKLSVPLSKVLEIKRGEITVSAEWDWTHIFVQCHDSCKWYGSTKIHSMNIASVADNFYKLVKLKEKDYTLTLKRNQLVIMSVEQSNAFKEVIALNHTIQTIDYTSDGVIFVSQDDCASLGRIDIEQRCQLTPVEVPLMRGHRVAKLCCGFNHVAILGSCGNIFTFGLGTRGQLGLGDLQSCSTPTLVDGIAGVKMVDVACGGWHSASVSTFGDVYTWGYNRDFQLGLGCSSTEKPEVVTIPTLVDFNDTNVELKSISCGTRHCIALTKCGRVYGWGWSAYGQLGTVTECYVKPVEISFSSENDNQWKAESVSCGPWNSFIELRKNA